MQQVKILLLDCKPASELGGTLRRILECTSALQVEVRFEPLEVCAPPFGGRTISKVISELSPDLIFCVLSPGVLTESCSLLQHLRNEDPLPPIVVVMEAHDPKEMFELLKLGVADFVTPPLKAIDIVPRIWRLIEQTHRREALTAKLKENLGLKQLVGESPAFIVEIRKIPLVANCDVNVLLSGETGTGKELCARAIHYLSSRAHRAFIPISCGAIPTELMENELFGHERGAFTSAVTSQLGLVHESDGGTLFIDEIDCLPLLAQVKLLRFLQEKEYRPLGSTKVLHADVRVIAATNIGLELAVKDGKLRQDLYYRLNIIQLRLPPLRERREDIPLLAHHFLSKYSAEFKRVASEFSSDALHKLVHYDWSGNVRELEHVVESAVVLSEGNVIRANDIVLQRMEAEGYRDSFQEAKAKTIAQFEKTYIHELLVACRGNITKAAQMAHKNRRAFWELIRKHRIDVQLLRQSSL